MPDTTSTGELAQLFINLAYLCTHDLATERQETKMAQDNINDTIDKLDVGVQLLIEQDKIEKDEIAALQAAATASANGDVLAPGEGDKLRGLLAKIEAATAAPVSTDPPVEAPPTETPDPPVGNAPLSDVL